MTYKTCALTLMLGVGCFLPAAGQETWEKEGEGEIKDLEIEMTKERQISLPRANRYFEKVPPRPYEPIVPAIVYQVRDITFASPNYVPVIRPLRIRQEELTKLYSNYVSAGVGNYTSFMVDGSAATKRDKKKMLGADFFWRSFGAGPVDGDNSAQSVTRINAFGNFTMEAVKVGGTVSYLNRRGYFYGYAPGTDVDRDILKQVYENFAADISFENSKKTELNYRFDGGFSRLGDAYVSSESEYAVKFDGDYQLKEGRKLTLKAELFFIKRQDSLYNQNRNLIRVQPAYAFQAGDKLFLTAGLNVAVTGDTFVDGSEGVKIFPHFKAEYQATRSLTAYGILTGNVDKVNLHTLAAQNFWLDANQPMVHTERAVQAEGGIRVAAGARFNTRLGLSFTSFKSPYFFQAVRDAYNPAGTSVGLPVDKFELVYDKTMAQLNPYVEASYYHADVFSATLRMDYFQYKMDQLLEPWHRPTYRGDLRIQYNVFNKLFIQAGMMLQGGMKAQDPSTLVVQTLATATDLNLKVRYFLSRQLSAFVQFDNILANQYPIYFNYPARGFQGMVGASWSF